MAMWLFSIIECHEAFSRWPTLGSPEQSSKLESYRQNNQCNCRLIFSNGDEAGTSVDDAMEFLSKTEMRNLKGNRQHERDSKLET